MKRFRKVVALTLMTVALFHAAPAGRGQKNAGRVFADSEVYRAPEPSPEARAEMERKLAEARAAYERNPRDADAVIWLGRRTAYLGRFNEAIAVFTEGVRRHPRDARMYRHRGHRYITTRRFGEAVKDLKRAAKLVAERPDEVEPDGQPNARGVPTSTLNSNIWYHLGLAYYVKGDFKSAARAYRECLKFSKNADMLAATSHWLYMTLRRLKRDEEARRVLEGIRDDADVIENHDYQRLLLMYKGRLTPEALMEEADKKRDSVGFATVGYGVGNFYFYTGRALEGFPIFSRIVNGPQRTSFGYIAAEAEQRRAGIHVNHVRIIQD
ncbi:MAG TPA: tetratricopeptide repeat protein [Pyrinomonadaceae bacterium]